MRSSVALLAIMLLPSDIVAQESADPSSSIIGDWDSWLITQGRELPIQLRIRSTGDGLEAAIRNGPEEILAPVTRAGSEFRVVFPWYDAHVSFIAGPVTHSYPDDPIVPGIHGSWNKRRGPEQFAYLHFLGTRAAKRPALDLRTTQRFTGRWAVSFSGSPDLAVGIFAADEKHGLTGTFLTTTGDYRYLTGTVDGDQLTLSCFDGAHAFLFKSRIQVNGSLAGDFWSGDSWHETWTAGRDDAAALPDPLAEVQAATGVALKDLSFADLDGKPRSLGDPTLAGKARIITVFGSWCPNCHDEGPFLAELDRRYRERGLSIVGLAFEVTGIFERDAIQVRKFADRHGIAFPLLLAGVSEKSEAAKSLKLLSRLKAYPTTIFLDRNDKVRAIWSGYSGPATGVAHAHLRERFEGLVEDLLAGH